MKVSELNPYTVIAHFTSHSESIKKLYRNNHNFQTLCADYQQCAKALHYWNNSDLPEAPKRRKEYQALLSELGAEISLILNNTNTYKKD